MATVSIRASIPFEKQFQREKYVSCLNTTCLDTLRLQSALQQQKFNCSISHFYWLPLVSWHRLESTRCLTSITDVQSKMQKKDILICSQAQSKHFYNKVMFIPEHSVPGGNLLLEILCSNILYSQQCSQSKFPPSQQRASQLPIHLMTAPSWSLLVSPGITHSVGFTISSGLCSEITFLSHHQPSKLTKLHQTSGSEHLKAENKTFPRVSRYIRHCQQALTRLQEWGRDFGEHSGCSDTSAHGAWRE